MPPDQASPHGSNSSMLSAFDLNNELTNLADTNVFLRFYTNLFIVDLIPSEINELALDFNLDLAKHPAHKILNLPAIYSFANVNEFCRAVAINGA